MNFLSWLFFCLSPFALFCSESGNGLILCPVFVVLGFICKWAGENSGGTPRAVVKVDPNEFWKWHYKDRISSVLAQKDSISDGLMAYKDQEARRWATTICGYHNAWVPPEATQEQIARANGVITEQMVKEKAVNKDRIQIGKYFLMKELKKKYYGKRFGKDGRGERYYHPYTKIEKDRYKIKLSDGHSINEKWIELDYKMSLREIWDSFSEREKSQATKWINEYEEKLLKLVNGYIDEGHDFYNVDIDF